MKYLALIKDNTVNHSIKHEVISIVCFEFKINMIYVFFNFIQYFYMLILKNLKI